MANYTNLTSGCPQNVTDALHSTWTKSMGQCVLTQQQYAALIIGLSSNLFWLVAQAPWVWRPKTPCIHRFFFFFVACNKYSHLCWCVRVSPGMFLWTEICSLCMQIRETSRTQFLVTPVGTSNPKIVLRRKRTTCSIPQRGDIRGNRMWKGVEFWVPSK